MEMKKKILVVEDDKDMHLVYRELLGEKYDVEIAKDTAAAMQKLAKNKYDIMILDIILPRQTGDTFFVRLRKDPKYNDMKVLCITVLGDVSDQLKQVDESVECLSKPFTKDELIKKLNMLF